MKAAMKVDQYYAEKSSWKSDLFKGKVVYVTGGSGTICKAQTKALVALGANAAIIGRNDSKAQAAAKEIAEVREGSKVIAFGNVDVRDVHQLIETVKSTVEQLGRIDFVVVGAAGNFLADFNSISSKAFQSVVGIDLIGSFNTVKATFDELKRTKGSIIFVSATLHYYGIPLQSHASAAKAGVDALSNALAVEFGPLGIRCNCIAPGAIGGDGDENEDKVTEGMKRLTIGGKKGLEKIIKKIPLQRLGTTTDIAETTVFLFSPAADYVTGTIHVVDGAMWHTGFGSSEEVYPDNVKERLLRKAKI